MKKLFIETRKKFNSSDIDFSVLDKIPENKISIGATVQYLNLITLVKKYLENKGKKIIIKKGVNYDGHVIGCNSSAFDVSADGLLLLTDGKFHAINNAIQLEKEIYVFNGKTLDKVEMKEIEKIKKEILGKKKKFLSANVVGLVLSNKEGQRNNLINKVKRKIESLEKKVYVFECDCVDVREFENFPDIGVWVNTACFGLARDDKKIINLIDILEFLN